MAYSKLYLFLGLNLSVILYSQVLADIDVSPTLTVESNLPPMTDELNGKLILDLKAYFSLLDMDGDGSINNKELETLFLSFGQNPTDFTLQASTNRLDADVDGTIDFPKFLNLMVRKRTYKELKEAFHFSDKDQNGFVSVFEFRYFMTNHGQKLTDEEVDEIFREADVDGDGQMNSEEFVKSYHDKVKGHGK